MTIIDRPATVSRRLRSSLSRVAELVATPLVPSDYLDIVSPLRSTTDLRGRIVAIEPETADAATLVIKPGRGWLPHTPGQYIRIGVDIDGVRLWRAYSLTSPLGRADGCITVTVKAIPDGVVSNFLVRRMQPGTVVQLDQATGEFVLPPVAPTKVLFVTGGSGITPVMGMLRNLPAGIDDIVMLHSAPTADDVIFSAELEALADSKRIRLIVRHTDADGMLGTDNLLASVPDLAEREVWACGPIGMLDLLEAHWEAAGHADRIHTERFRPSLAAVGEGGTVTFTKLEISADSDGSVPILDAGEAAGALMPSGCRMGICFGCVLPLREGSVRDLRNGQITSAIPGDGVLVQTCVSAPAGACSIDL